MNLSKDIDSKLTAQKIIELDQHPERGYLARQLVQCTLPHRDPGDMGHYIRKDGNFMLVVQPGINPITQQSYGLPFGSIPRLLLLWLTSEAVRTQERRVELGNTLSQFLQDIGLSRKTGRGKRGDAKRLREQLHRLFSARFSFHYTDGDEKRGHLASLDMPVAGVREFWWDYKNPDEASFFDSYVVLGEEFFKAVTSNPVPFDVNTIKQLKRSPLAIDLYCWLCWRIYRLPPGQNITVPYRDLESQFGSEYHRQDNFKSALTEALQKVSDVLPSLQCEISPHGLSITGITQDHQPIKARKNYNVLPSRTPKDPFDLSIKDLLKASEYSRGWSPRALRTEWKKWCIAKGIVPKRPLPHFIRFVQKHVEINGSNGQ